MTTVITTSSGTVYVLTSGERAVTVTRYGRDAVVGYDAHIAGDAVTALTNPVVGQAWRFATAAGPFTTTAVTHVRHA